jgi:hypothetical protein
VREEEDVWMRYYQVFPAFDGGNGVNIPILQSSQPKKNRVRSTPHNQMKNGFSPILKIKDRTIPSDDVPKPNKFLVDAIYRR